MFDFVIVCLQLSLTNVRFPRPSLMVDDVKKKKEKDSKESTTFRKSFQKTKQADLSSATKSGEKHFSPLNS